MFTITYRFSSWAPGKATTALVSTPERVGEFVALLVRVAGSIAGVSYTVDYHRETPPALPSEFTGPDAKRYIAL